MVRFFVSFCFFLVFCICSVGCSLGYAVKIGVIVPLQHTALDEIIAGFQETLKPHLSLQDQIIVQNANGDPLLQHQIITQMNHKGVDYFVPLGTSASLMVLSMIKSKPILCVAMSPDEKVLETLGSRVGVVDDALEVAPVLDFIKTFIPAIKTLGLLYDGNSEKIFPEVQNTQTLCAQKGLELISRKIDTVSEIHQFAKPLITKVDALLILRDNKVVSGMSDLVHLARQHKKLLIAMDDGSVKKGAHFAIGIQERTIGVQAAQNLLRILKGSGEKGLQRIRLRSLSLFYNETSLALQPFISLKDLEKAAASQGYPFERKQETSGDFSS